MNSLGKLTSNPADLVKEPDALLEILTAVQFVAGVAFLFCSFAVAHTWNSGFNCLLSALLFLTFPVASYYVITYRRNPMNLGAIMGGGLILCFLSFETAIYWGQLSLCEEVAFEIGHYSCSQKVAYRFVCFFGIVMFLLQLSFTTFLVYSRESVLKDFNEYEELGISGESALGPDTPGGPLPPSASADL